MRVRMGTEAPRKLVSVTNTGGTVLLLNPIRDRKEQRLIGR